MHKHLIVQLLWYTNLVCTKTTILSNFDGGLEHVRLFWPSSPHFARTCQIISVIQNNENLQWQFSMTDHVFQCAGLVLFQYSSPATHSNLRLHIHSISALKKFDQDKILFFFISEIPCDGKTRVSIVKATLVISTTNPTNLAQSASSVFEMTEVKFYSKNGGQRAYDEQQYIFKFRTSVMGSERKYFNCVRYVGALCYNILYFEFRFPSWIVPCKDLSDG